jgi:hypothetical protein
MTIPVAHPKRIMSMPMLTFMLMITILNAKGMGIPMGRLPASHLSPSRRFYCFSLW